MDLISLYILLRLLRRNDGPGPADDQLDESLQKIGRTTYDVAAGGCGCVITYIVVMLILTLLVGGVVTLWRSVAGH